MSKKSTQQLVADTLRNSLVESSRDGEYDSIDVLREFRRQAGLLQEKHEIQQLLHTDPFEQWNEDENLYRKIRRLGESLEVVEVQRTSTLPGYSFIDATVKLPLLKPMDTKARVKQKLHQKMGLSKDGKPNSTLQNKTLELYFRFEKQGDKMFPGEGSDTPQPIDPGHDTPTVSYTIDVRHIHKPNDRLLWLQLWADGNRRSEYLRPINIEESEGADNGMEEDGWEDMEDEENTHAESPKAKRPRKEKDPGQSPTEMEIDHPNKSAKTDDERMQESTGPRNDRYIAGIDPEILMEVLEWIDLDMEHTPAMSEVTAFFLLMTFPFFEHEWDIIGYLLESIFGSEDSDGESGPSDEVG